MNGKMLPIKYGLQLNFIQASIYARNAGTSALRVNLWKIPNITVGIRNKKNKITHKQCLELEMH